MKSRVLQYIIIGFVDACIVAFSALMPLVLRFGIFTVDPVYFDRAVFCLPIDITIAIIILAAFRLYNRVWSFAGMSELVASFGASLVIEAVYMIYRIIFLIPMPRSYYLFEWIILFLLIAASRIFVRFYRHILRRGHAAVSPKRVLIVGAGSAGSLLIAEFAKSRAPYKVVAFVDDNPEKRGKYIQGIRIEGDRHDIPRLVDKLGVEGIIIAMPATSSAEIREIIAIANKTNAAVKILPHYMTKATTSITSSVREVNYEDLLGRNIIEIQNKSIRSFVSGKTVVVTGAGGSIGSELCRQIMANKPGRLIMLDIYENTLYDVSTELMRRYPDAGIVALVTSVCDEAGMDDILGKYQPDIIYHAAAHKHVPLMEDSPCEAVKNNCLGTLTLARLADKYGVAHFILISTDKAVRPTNVMGATKRICEMIVQSINKNSSTRFVAVRFGNVLGSNGSVIPLFLRQIEEGGPVTVTHKEVTRFFMTIPEAVSLVLRAGTLEDQGELFVLDMGEPVRIYELAENLIKLKGLTPNKDIEIKITGLRPGEKLYEELLMASDDLVSTDNDLIFVEKPADLDSSGFFAKLDTLVAAAAANSPEIKEEIAKVCDTYKVKTPYVETMKEKDDGAHAE
ncbi:MAG: polysaccharide biosynthesis protein [Clostridiales Family XIII bacterium]|nr:polysaccharide biosynthesis protein [Clostridiales Family XIII bacterium]